uniref:inositol-phosphate phosphatase n=1 Tax=Lygus hesperus TaxID=30085 RepID=A0A0A9XPL4_LYGHE
MTHLNSSKIQLIRCNFLSTELQDALLCGECSHENFVKYEEYAVKNYRTVHPLVHGIRTYGTAAYGMTTVGLGANDAYFEFGPHVWDIAAANVIVTEAGGVVKDTAGGPVDIMSRRFLAASTTELAEELVKNIQQYTLPRDDE